MGFGCHCRYNDYNYNLTWMEKETGSCSTCMAIVKIAMSTWQISSGSTHLAHTQSWNRSCKTWCLCRGGGSEWVSMEGGTKTNEANLIPVPVFFKRCSLSTLIFLQRWFHQNDIKLGMQITQVKGLQITLKIPKKAKNSMRLVNWIRACLLFVNLYFNQQAPWIVYMMHLRTK